MPPSTAMIMMMDAQLSATMMHHSNSKVPRVLSESNLSTASTADTNESDLDTMMDVLPAVPEVSDEPDLSETRPQPLDNNNVLPAELRTSKPSTRRLSSILKHYLAEDIPIKGKGWKNLPQPNLKTIPKSRCSVGRRPSDGDKLHVGFNTVEFRCHDQCVGDNPSVSIGTPVSLDWYFEDMDPIDLDTYEAQREGSRRNLRQMMMNYFQRRTLLSYRYGIAEKELDEAARAADKIRQQRSVTRALLPTFLLRRFGHVGRPQDETCAREQQASELPPGQRQEHHRQERLQHQ
jgi:hypothetical protein